MKKIWLLIAFIAIVSCKDETDSATAIVSGKITNNRGNEISLKKANDKEFMETIKVSEDGSFLDTLLIETGIYSFQNGINRTEIYIATGGSLVINFDSNDFEKTLTFSGDGSEINNYLTEKQKVEKKLLGEENLIYKLDEAEFVAKVKNIKSTLEKLVSSSKGIDNDFEEKEKRNLNYTYFVRLNNYQIFHGFYADDTSFKTSEGFLKGFEEIKYDNEIDYLYSRDYRTLTTSYFSLKAAEVARKEQINNDMAFIKVAGAIESKAMKNDLIYERVKSAIKNTDDIEDLYKKYMESSTNDAHKKEITEAYNKLKKVVNGQASPKFIDYENLAGGKTSLDDLKGSYIFINIWSTRSSPTTREMNSIKDLEKTYAGKNLKFVSISVDKAEDRDKWKSVVAQNKFSGLHLFADKEMESSFVKEYFIKTTPHYILIDPAGNIVNANAPRLSSIRFKRLIDELNI